VQKKIESRGNVPAPFFLLRVRAEGGRANAELAAFLAETLALPKRNVAVVSGETSRDKILRIDDCSRERAEAAFGFALPESSRGNG